MGEVICLSGEAVAAIADQALRVLVVEDEAIIRTFVCFALRRAGCRIVADVAYGEEAVDVAKNQEIDLVFMDIRLKGEMDGIQAARELAAISDVNIVFMSAYDRSRLGIGDSFPNMIEYLIKPVHADDIARVLQALKAQLNVDTAAEET